MGVSSSCLKNQNLLLQTLDLAHHLVHGLLHLLMAFPCHLLNFWRSPILLVGQRSLEGPANGCVNLNWNLPSNSLCSMRRLVLQNLMSIQPGGVAFSCPLQLHKDRCDDPPTLSFLPLW
ncbi:unnamed protein product [Microthlaspi erraticum]|uniref:Uncharacterized protein n=1 Tax=Microthlaspi erraticum TaxID=1685480 RepID=A0A6D2JUN4_9BRAS|nr:unnamed protein product [Microthlaspi erraticum]